MLIAAACLLALVACKQKGNDPVQEALLQQRDSLTRIIEQKDNEIDDMMATMNDIQEGFRAINEAEERVTLAKAGEGSTSVERIRENIEFIQGQMQQNRELISKLRNQLRQSTVKGDQLRRTLESLTQQLEEKDVQLRQLQAELEAKDVQIGELNQQVTTLSTNVSNLKEESSQKSQTMSSYTLLQDANKQYILRITNPQLFWSTSKYLVVLVK